MYARTIVFWLPAVIVGGLVGELINNGILIAVVGAIAGFGSLYLYSKKR